MWIMRGWSYCFLEELAYTEWIRRANEYDFSSSDLLEYSPDMEIITAFIKMELTALKQVVLEKRIEPELSGHLI